ncbi:MAG TPA: dephospho-CoA kinase [Balneolaceae bacterium]|nr:dephospho-CoA kinase [Balneolaceae bacterium]
MMKTVGITGGIGSGKSTVCDVWAELGAYVLNADELAKRVMAENSKAREELIESFGEESFRADGSLNREHLAAEAFERGRVKELNAIVHPKLPEATLAEMKKARQNGHDVFVYEAALLLENLETYDFDYIVLVLADERHRLERVQKRDDSSPEEIKQRMNKQRNFEESTEQVDFIIYNNGTLAELEKKAKELYQNFLT